MGYSEIETMIGAMKRAAIDASMFGYRKEGGDYVKNDSSSYVATIEHVSMPDANGEGGGDWSMRGWGVIPPDVENPYPARFAAIRARIDRAMAPWRQLPDPTELDDEIEKCRQISRGLSGAAQSKGDRVTGAGPLGGYIDLIMQNTSAMSGTAVAAFKATCLARLGPTIGGLHAISLVQGAAIAAEQGLWESARHDVASIVSHVTTSLNAIFDAGTATDWSALFTVVGWAAKGISIFATGGMSAAAEVTGLTVEILTDVTHAEPKKFSGTDVDSVLGELESALNALNKDITTEERKLDDNLRTNLENIGNDKKSYDITTDPITLDEINGGKVIRMDYGLVQEITDVYMPDIAKELGTLAPIDLDARISAIFRDEHIGIGIAGPTGAWIDLNLMLYSLINTLQWDVTKSAKNLELAAEDFKSYDKSTATKLDKLVAEMDDNPYEPWSTSA